ncbi:MAG: MBL fold metallo-hydrolase [Fibrobacteria bacterium]|nr:MBL fold metallo-hydrolase [Fibrobacteria bacterium]
MKIVVKILVSFWLIVTLHCDFLSQSRVSEASLELWFIDVGQGDGALLHAPNEGDILIDLGPDSLATYAFLHEKGIDTLHTVIITHADYDHYAGFYAVAQHLFIKRIILPIDTSTEVSWSDLLALISEKKIPVESFYLGDTVELGEDIFLSFLWPIRSSQAEGNANSTVTRLSFGNSSALFTGDIEEKTELRMLELNLRIESEIIKISHHGSRSSSSLPFLSKVNPDWAIISCDSSVYGHPHKETLNGIKQVNENIRVLRTDQAGHIGFELFTNRIELLE